MVNFKNILLAIVLSLACSVCHAKNLYIFTAGWCRPCKALKDFITSSPEKFQDVTISIIDIDQYPKISKKYSVKSIPTSILLIDEVEQSRLVGFSSGSSYLNWFNKWTSNYD